MWPFSSFFFFSVLALFVFPFPDFGAIFFLLQNPFGTTKEQKEQYEWWKYMNMWMMMIWTWKKERKREWREKDYIVYSYERKNVIYCDNFVMKEDRISF